MADEHLTSFVPSTPWWHSIGRRFILYIILFSSAVTLISTGIQLYFEYRRDLQNIDTNLRQIERSYLKGLAAGLWSFNERLLQVQLEGILDLPDMRFLEIRQGESILMSVGHLPTTKGITRDYSLKYPHRGEELELGRLVVVVGLDGVYHRLLDRVVVILATQAIKTFFVSVFIFLLFHAMVGRHLGTMAGYAKSLDLNRLDQPLFLSRTGRYITTDELGMVVAAFNEMRENLLRDIEARQQADKTLQMLAESSAVLTGQELFDTIVRILCDFFHGECAILGELTAADTITARAMVLDGAMVNDFSYALAGSPCADVHQKGYCLFPERITSLFPSDQALITMGAEGYAGVPILGRDQQPLGILCVISRSKLRPPDRAEEIMRILQSRASAELERLRADLEKEKLEARLRQAQKMEAIGTLAGGIAHDFNNLLSPIIGYTEMAQLEMNGAEKERWKVEEVLRAALRAKDIVQQILTFSRQREQERTNLELQPVIKETLKLLRVSLPATIDIRQDVDPACGPVHADLTQMQQVVMNLCTNAFHAMSEQGGVLEVTLKEVTVSSEDRLGANPLTPGRYACLTVGDTGHGMDKATLERIFDPYFTTKEQGKGTGLGLALVHGIVKSHQGSVSVYSEPGQGALFKVYLPISKELAPTTAQAGPNNGSPLPGGNETVLLVDDEESLVRMATKMLEHLGYTVVGVTDSTEALALFRSQPQHYDLVITDQTMPGMTGGELAEKLITIRPDVPIVLCTGFSEVLSEERAREIGIREYLHKPIFIHELALRVRKALNNGMNERSEPRS